VNVERDPLVNKIPGVKILYLLASPPIPCNERRAIEKFNGLELDRLFAPDKDPEKHIEKTHGAVIGESFFYQVPIRKADGSVRSLARACKDRPTASAFPFGKARK
jgi:hypothetical protein